jgi:CheY-like chemotaxis protein
MLLAEDNQINQLIAVGLLRKLGYIPDIVATGLAVLEAVQATPYDIILMDCQMPEMDGYDAARAIRRLEESSEPGSRLPVHIIAVTAHAMEGDREKCIAAGMDGYLSKPIRFQELQTILEQWQTSGQIEARQSERSD